jgi:hypothetical protein
MPVIFSGKPGRVAILNDDAVPAVTPLVQPRDDKDVPSITAESQRSIVTRLQVSQQANVQFLHTLGNDIYIYVFGDRIGQMTLSGVSFSTICTGEGDSGEGSHGIENMLDWYQQYKVSAKDTATKIMLGTKLIQGFVTGVSFDVQDRADIPWIGLFNISLFVVPDR